MKLYDKLNLLGILEMNAHEMKEITGGKNGRVSGVRCYENTCYVDVEYEDETDECDIPLSMEACREFAGWMSC